MSILFILVGLLNIVDGWLTYVGLSRAFITEQNPLMAGLYEINPHLLWGFKLFLGLLAIILGIFFTPQRHRVLWKASLGICFFIYVGIMYLHVHWIMYATNLA